MKAHSYFILLLIIVAFACCNRTKKLEQIITLSAGKMPALVTDKQAVYVVFGSGDSLLLVSSTNGGKTFSAPVLIDTLSGLVASSTRGPQIAITANGLAVIALNKAGNLYSFTKGNDTHWKRTSRINDEPDVDKEGFSGLSSDESNNLFAIWTDLREDKHNKIYGARSNDGGVTWEKNKLVYQSPDSTVCECCKPSVAMQGSHVYVMFRNWLNGNRDLYLIESSDGGISFEKAQKLGKGSWKLNGCPMDGGGLAINVNGDVQTVWRRENKIFAAEPGKPEKEIGEGKGCAIATINGKNVYAWTDKDGEIVCMLPNGENKILGKGSLPIVKAVDNDKIVCVWQDGDLVKSLTLSL